MTVFSSSETYQRRLYGGGARFSPTPLDNLKTRTSTHLLEVAQVEDRVADQLTRPVEGDETTAVGLVDLGPQQPQLVQRCCWVRFLTDPSCINWRVLTQQESMSRTGTMPLHIDLLEPQSLQVGDQAQADHLNNRPVTPHLDLEPHREPGQSGKQQQTCQTARNNNLNTSF